MEGRENVRKEEETERCMEGKMQMIQETGS